MKRKYKVRIDSILKPGDEVGTVNYLPAPNLIGVLTDLQKNLEGSFEFSVIETKRDGERMYCIFKCKKNVFENVKNLLLDVCGTKFNFNFKCNYLDWRL